MNKEPLEYSQVAYIADSIQREGRMPSLLEVSTALEQTRISSRLLILLEKWYLHQFGFHKNNMLHGLNKVNALTSDLPKKFETISKSLSLMKSIFEFSSKNALRFDENESNVLNEKFKEMNDCIQFLATHDELTELPNCDFLMIIMKQLIDFQQKNQESMAVFFIDLDHFKMINHTLGNHIGNKVLQAIANRLLLVNQENNTVARYGGDEFIVLAPKIKDKQDVERIAEELLQMLSLPLTVDGHVISVSISLGVSVYPEDGNDYESLINHAELAMYHAKQRGRNTYQLFSYEADQLANHAKLTNALHHALKRNELYLVYQPVINFKHHCVDSVEALLRWDSPEFGNISPLEFIPMAESSDLIFKIGEWVIEQAVCQMVHWHALGFTELTVAVNLSARQLHQKDLPAVIGKILEKTGLPARYLELELTENSFIDSSESVLETMQTFKDMGIKLAIDDFGTGYSCLSYLKRFPVDKIKIDKAFVTELANSANNAVIIKAIIRLGHNLNLKILAEGVENNTQKSFVISHGCDYGQGFYFQTPERPEIILNFLREYAAGSL